jgi:hypothetical protein
MRRQLYDNEFSGSFWKEVSLSRLGRREQVRAGASRALAVSEQAKIYASRREQDIARAGKSTRAGASRESFSRVFSGY